jgi:WD40 repeat protein
VTCACFSPSGRNVASASCDGTVRVWAPSSIDGDASRAAVLACKASVSALAWDPRAEKAREAEQDGAGDLLRGAVLAWRPVHAVGAPPPRPASLVTLLPCIGRFFSFRKEKPFFSLFS